MAWARSTLNGPRMTRPAPLAATLSDRERQVFERLVLGASNAEIADELVITVETVKTHVKRILRKIGAINRSEAIALYLDEANDISDSSETQPTFTVQKFDLKVDA